MTTLRKRQSQSPNAAPGKRQLNSYITMESSAILDAVLERDGVPFSAQIDRALKLWAKEKGIEVTHAPTPEPDGNPR
jgi:hypothetical protein